MNLLKNLTKNFKKFLTIIIIIITFFNLEEILTEKIELKKLKVENKN